MITRADQLMREVLELHKHLGHITVLGGNFIDCLTCRIHQHADFNGDRLIQHGRLDPGCQTRFITDARETLPECENVKF